MSSRQLRKLQQRETEQARLREQKSPQAGSEDEEKEEEEEEQATLNKPSLFANLAALQGDEDEDEDEAEHCEGHTGEQEDDIESRRTVNKELDSNPASASKAKKSKKKKKKKGKNVEKKIAVSGVSDPGADGETDDIDAALHELNIKIATGANESSDPIEAPSSDFLRICELLSVNTRHLKVANEMRNLFGRAAVENHEDAGGEVPRGGRRRQRGVQQPVGLESALKGNHPPGKGLPELTLRRNIFIQGKEDWPKASTGGLTMTIEDEQKSRDGPIFFRFNHDKAYDNVQLQFNLLVEFGTPEKLIGLLRKNPYHVSLLLQVSKIAKDQGDHALSSDLIERALFTFGRAAQSLFGSKLSKGEARMNFSRPENRELWLAGYHYIRSLMMKGTYRTALEWAKILLALDPSGDPYCMDLMIHHLAIRAHEFQYLLNFTNNTIFEQSYRMVSHSSPSIALAALQLKEAAKCRSHLQQSIQTYPWLFCRLFQELNLDGPPPAIWGIVPRTDAEKLYTEIYVRQTKDLWNTPEATALLMEVTHAMESVRQEDVAKVSNFNVDLSVARFVYLDNTPALMALVPSVLLHRMPNSDSDPLPPDGADNLFTWDSQRMPFVRARNRGDDGGLQVDDLAPLRERIEAELEMGEDATSDDEPEEEPESQGASRVWRRLSRIFGRLMVMDVDEENTEHGLHE